jgi:hypothetical protein
LVTAAGKQSASTGTKAATGKSKLVGLSLIPVAIGVFLTAVFNGLPTHDHLGLFAPSAYVLVTLSQEYDCFTAQLLAALA